MLATTFSLGALSLNAQGKATSITTSDDRELVYSSVSDLSWTRDANLFATQGFYIVVDAIIAASSANSKTLNRYSPFGNYPLSASDFSSNDRTLWFVAMTDVNHLNKIHHGGSNQ
ncbi:hypothetical protein [Methylophilus methylotrophus]|uniref:hypothetical protein n=1 Tax=Methylophilus methylotrophus TaxID=17 RepID=UPI00035D43A0|nr:hypothetical protein [Methylophilus methylotrophus]